MSIFKNNYIVGITAGLVAAVIAPILVPALKRGSRPLAKSLIKGGIMLYGKGREAVAGAGEVMEDVIAEVHAEAYEKKISTRVAGDDVAHQSASQPLRGNGGSPPSHEKNDPAPAPAASEEGGLSDAS
jgi:hypothetical protein